MLAHPVEDADLDAITPEAFAAEWKWDGIRVQFVSGMGADGRRITRMFSRTGEDVSAAFPDLVEAIRIDGAIDGELLVVRDGMVESFNMLQQRLNRKTVTARMLAEFPAHIRAYDLLFDRADDLRDLPFSDRRTRLEALLARHEGSRLDLSPLIPFASLEDLVEKRSDPSIAHAGADHAAIEGVMLKRLDSAYLPGRPKASGSSGSASRSSSIAC